MSSNVRRDFTGLLDQGVVSVSTLLTTTLFIRGAGMEVFGVVSLVWLVLLFGTGVQHAAVIAPAYTLLPKLDRAAASELRGWLLLVQVAFVATLLFVLAWSWAVPGFSLLPRAAGLSPALLFLGTRLSFTFLRLQLFVVETGPRRALFVDSVHAVASIGALAYLAAGENLTASSGLCALAAAAFGASLLAIPSFLRLGLRLGIADKALMLRHWQLSKWLVGKSLAQWFTTNSFLAALGTIQGPLALGGVRAAQTLIGVAGVVIQGLENLIPARAAAIYGSGGSEQLRNFLRTSLWRWYGYLCLGLLPIVLFPAFFLKLLTGRAQAGLFEPLYFFAFGSLLALGALFLQICLRSVERVGALFWAQLTSGLLGAIAAVPVTLAYGLRGCMVGIVVQQLIVFALLVRPAKRCVQLTRPAELGRRMRRKVG